MSEPAILARDLFLAYGGRPALRGLDIAVAAGERVAVLGPSGAGKTSLLRLCAGFERPSSGRLRVDGVAVESAGVRRLTALRRGALGLIRQHYHRSLPGELTVREIAGLPLRLAGRSDPRRVGALLDAAGLGERADARPEELSGGEQQRVAVCAALAKDPRIVLADEPTGELDARTSAAIVDLLLTLAGGATVVIVTHDPRVAERADRIVHVRDGRVSAEGAAEQALVVDEQGWVRLPTELRGEAGIGRHVRATRESRGLLLEPLGHEARAALPPPAAPPGALAAGPAVALRGVTRVRGRRTVLDGLSHDFAPGRVHAVSGPSGSGKTTLLMLLAALDSPDAGTISAPQRVDGLSVAAAAAWRRDTVGYLNQHTLLAGHLTAYENVALALQLRGHDPGAAGDWLDWVGLATVRDRRAARLSGGEQRRVALAQALAGSPPLILADEPTAHLDRANGRHVIDLLHRCAAHGATVVACTHDPDLIETAGAVLAL